MAVPGSTGPQHPAGLDRPQGAEISGTQRGLWVPGGSSVQTWGLLGTGVWPTGRV